MQAFVLAAGFGKRMGELTKDRPKPLLPVNGVPLIHYTLFQLSRWNVSRVFVNVHYLGDAIVEELRDFPHFPIVFSHEQPEILGTAGGLRKIVADAKLPPDESLILMNPDTILLPHEADAPAPLAANTDALLYLRPLEADNPATGFVFNGTPDEHIRMSESGTHYYIGYSVVRAGSVSHLPYDEFAELGPVWRGAGERGRLRGRLLQGESLDAGLRRSYADVMDRDLIPASLRDAWRKFLGGTLAVLLLFGSGVLYTLSARESDTPPAIADRRTPSPASGEPSTDDENTQDAGNEAEPKQAGTTEKSAESEKKPAKPEFYEPSKEGLKEAEIRVAVRQLSAELIAAYQYRVRHSIPRLERRLKDVAEHSPEYHYFHALSLYEDGEKGQALLALDKAVYKKPHFSRAWNLKGVILSEAGRLPESREAFRKAVEASPYNPTYVYNLASAAYRMDEAGPALALAERAVGLKANLSEAYYLQGLIHRDQGRGGPALLAFGKAREFGQDGHQFLLDYMLAAENGGDEKTMLALAKDLSASREPGILRELARVHMRYGEYSTAADYLALLTTMPAATLSDKKRYVFALYKAGGPVFQKIQRMRGLEPEERKALIEYYRDLEKNKNLPDARDPVIDPVR